MSMDLDSKRVRRYGLRRHRDTLAIFNGEIELKPNSAPAYYNKGSLLFDLGRFEEALLSLEKAKDLGFTDPEISRKISLAHWNLHWCSYQDRSNCG